MKNRKNMVFPLSADQKYAGHEGLHNMGTGELYDRAAPERSPAASALHDAHHIGNRLSERVQRQQ